MLSEQKLWGWHSATSWTHSWKQHRGSSCLNGAHILGGKTVINKYERSMSIVNMKINMHLYNKNLALARTMNSNKQGSKDREWLRYFSARVVKEAFPGSKWLLGLSEERELNKGKSKSKKEHSCWFQNQEARNESVMEKVGGGRVREASRGLNLWDVIGQRKDLEFSLVRWELLQTKEQGSDMIWYTFYNDHL
jgi:hypothetical protein